MKMSTYDPSTCDLCGSTVTTPVCNTSNGRSMLSDRRLLKKDLVKLKCLNCGLIRSGSDQNDGDEFYRSDYQLGSFAEHYFYKNGAAISRSSVLCNWIVEFTGQWRWEGRRSCLEIGSGEGNLIAALQSRLPNVEFTGLEPSSSAARIANDKGIKTVCSLFEQSNVGKKFDFVISVAVLEHVPSPTEFLRKVKDYLRQGGYLVLVLPTQNRNSTDLFFSDHLHHFSIGTLQRYGKKLGFSDIGYSISGDFMPSFSILIWQNEIVHDSCGKVGNDVEMASQYALTFMKDMENLNELLEDLIRRERPIAVFGVNEAFWLAYCYSKLGDVEIFCGLDDEPGKPAYKNLPFQIIKPEDIRNTGIDDVILTMNSIYYDQAISRMDKLGVRCYKVFST